MKDKNNTIAIIANVVSIISFASVVCLAVIVIFALSLFLQDNIINSSLFGHEMAMNIFTTFVSLHFVLFFLGVRDKKKKIKGESLLVKAALLCLTVLMCLFFTLIIGGLFVSIALILIDAIYDYFGKQIAILTLISFAVFYISIFLKIIIKLYRKRIAGRSQ